MDKEIEFIDNDSDLLRLCRNLKGDSWLALDTEFERVNTYYPDLCLLQLCNGKRTAIVDPLNIENMDAMYELLYDTSITKVFHAARQDLELFFHLKGQIPYPLFDTQIAASILGYDEQIGYANLVKEVLGLELPKTETRTNWKRRPLTQNQMLYAADDVIYLAQIYDRFMSRLNNPEHLEKLNEELHGLTKPELYEPDPTGMWKKIKIARNLQGEALDVLKKLAAWRELTAREENLPRKWVVGDHALLEMAKSRPNDLNTLSHIKGLGKGLLNRHADELLAMLS